MTANHENGKKTTRKPDINLVSLASVKRVHPSYKNSPNIDYSDKLCLRPPEKSFKWREVLSPFEFKLGSTSSQGPPPEYLSNSQELVEQLKFGRAPDTTTPTDGTSSSVATTSSATSNKRSSTSQPTSSMKKLKAPLTCEPLVKQTIEKLTDIVYL